MSASSVSVQSWAVINHEGELVWSEREHHAHYAASIIKVALVAAVLRSVDDGVVGLDDMHMLGPVASVADGSPIVIDDDSADAYLRAHPSVSLSLVIERAITVSSNEASNHLFALVGFDAVNNVLKLCGCVDSMATRYFFDSKAATHGQSNVMSAHDAARVMWHAVYGDILGSRSRSFLRALLLAQRDRIAIPSGIPHGDPFGTTVGNKTGSTSTVGHDVAFVEPDDAEPFVIAILTTGAALEELHVHDAIADNARRAYELRVRT